MATAIESFNRSYACQCASMANGNHDRDSKVIHRTITPSPQLIPFLFRQLPPIPRRYESRIRPESTFSISGVPLSSSKRFVFGCILDVMPCKPSGDQGDTKTFTARVDFANRASVMILP